MFRGDQKYLCFLAVLASILSASVYADADAERGAKIYKVCASCHGFKGEGNQLVNAPKLSGMSLWYLARQLNNFRGGIRGSADDDAHGQTMAAMTGALTSEVLVDDVAAYIETLPNKHAPAQSVSGDVNRGATLYAPCAACHGDKGQGVQAMNAPSLTQLDDWYQVAQLHKFKSGMRGRHPQDTYGQQMAPMAGVLPDETAIADVVAYIGTLAN